jgi:guanylate kinase
MEDLRQKVNEYEAPESSRKLVARMRIALIVGIAAAGKDAVIREILSRDTNFAKIITTIPRAPRAGEIQDVSYHFIDEGKVRENLAKQKYFEAKIVHGRVYGTTTEELSRIFHENKIALGDVDVQGVEEYHRVCENLINIFVIPPSFETWQKRWAGRDDSTDENEKNQRMISAEAELDFALRSNYYHFVVNDDLAEAAEISRKIITDKKFAKKYDDESAKKIARELHDKIRENLGGADHQFVLRLE